MTVSYRMIEPADMPELFVIRTSVRENLMTQEELTAAGITPESLAQMYASTHKGWLCQVDGKTVGFAMGDGSTGEFWVLAVLPQYEGRGIGSELLRLVEQWLFSLGHKELWLWTDTDRTLRAYNLYQKRGWLDSEIKDGDLYMKKVAPAS